MIFLFVFIKNNNIKLFKFSKQMNNRLFASLHKLTLLYDENFLLLQKRFVHHHKEWEISKSLYLGKYRSQPQKANRNTHINEKKFRKVIVFKYFIKMYLIIKYISNINIFLYLRTTKTK